MQGRAIADRRPWAIAAALVVAAALAAVPTHARAQTAVQAGSTVDGSELVQTVPIHRQAKHGTVVLSLGPGGLPALATGDTLRASSVLQVSTTCVTPTDPRCIGVPYSYSPKFSAQLVLGDGAGAIRGSGVLAVSSRFQLGCGQKRPNRNHHCVLTLPDAPITIPTADQLPCLSTGCSLNLVVDAYSTEAKTGNVLVIGNDQPDGTVGGGRSRVNAIVIPAGQGPAPTSAVTTQAATPEIPVGGQRSGYHSVVYSARLDGLQAGDVLDFGSLQRTDISSSTLPMFVGSEVILAAGPNGVMGQPKYSTEEGQLIPRNGFNCTLGPSAFQTPCNSYEAGAVTITATPLTNAGLPKPLYVNVLSRAFPKIAQAAHASTVAVQPGGYLSVVRYPVSG